jgi:demethylmenaquinone methyltransferase/2-methoxy-6-polyprenyl-1,4-benzoquinol methylase
MFSAIAPRYDLLNHLLSFNVDRIWWQRTARAFDHILQRRDARVLDLCCGTGDMTLALRRRVQSEGLKIFGADFSEAMLQRALKKTSQKDVSWIGADALQLPLPDGSLDLVTAAFGFRNLANYDVGLKEIFRVLRRSGECGILEFAEPRAALGALYRLYFRHILPVVGTLISGVKGPYQYLPASVQRFPSPEEMLERMRQVGFRELSWTPYTFSIAGLYRGRK